MPIIRQGGESAASADSPAGAVDAARAYFRQLHQATAQQRRPVPMLGQFGGLGFERDYVPHFMRLAMTLGGLTLSGDEAHLAHARLDQYRRPPEEDPEQRITAEGRSFILAASQGLAHPGIKMGKLLVEGLAEERSPAVRLADEALLALRLDLATQAFSEQPDYVQPLAA